MLWNVVNSNNGPSSCWRSRSADFFWGDNDHRHAVHPIPWPVICQPKHEGGLGLRPLKDVNTVLLAKLPWRLLKKPMDLWAQVLGAKYGLPPTCHCEHPFKPQSVVRRGLTSGYQLLEQGLWKDEQGKVDTNLCRHKSPRGVFSTKSAYDFIALEPHHQSDFNWTEL